MSRIFLFIIVLVLFGLAFNRPIYHREIPVDSKQIGEDSFIVMFEDGGVMRVNGDFLSIQRRVGTKVFGIWEVLD